MTPTMRCGRPSSRRSRPITAGSPPNRRRHSESEISATAAGWPGRSSSGVEAVPQHRLDTQEREERGLDAPALDALRVGLVVEAEHVPVEESQTLEAAALAAPVDGVASRDRMLTLALARPGGVGRHQALGFVEVERPRHPGVKAREHGGVGADAEREHHHDGDAREGIAPDYPCAVEDVAPHDGRRGGRDLGSRYGVRAQRFDPGLSWKTVG